MLLLVFAWPCQRADANRHLPQEHAGANVRRCNRIQYVCNKTRANTVFQQKSISGHGSVIFSPTHVRIGPR